MVNGRVQRKERGCNETQPHLCHFMCKFSHPDDDVPVIYDLSKETNQNNTHQLSHRRCPHPLLLTWFGTDIDRVKEFLNYDPA